MYYRYTIDGVTREVPADEEFDEIDKAIKEKKFGIGGKWELVEDGSVPAESAVFAPDDKPDNDFNGVLARF